ncbi:hypothetical protein BDV23DRAFT_176028 [Aspergillus alliaceus]|uniref:Uncharacterized protein n=1 Tax=Petromyces alliaceus TaxID=209559 RepID=A0A5N7BVA1_PETAA|nr:hypothetical protein BDV23DRAFT_176028 [Aspergillus alliaceus]
MGVFYILGSLMVTLVVSHHRRSPFVITYKNAGIPAMDHVRNAVVFISAVLAGSITAYGGHEHWVVRTGHPWAALLRDHQSWGGLSYISVWSIGADESRHTPYAQWWGLRCCLALIILELYLSIKSLGKETSAKNFFAKHISMIAVSIIWIVVQLLYRCPLWIGASKINLDEHRRFYAEHPDEGATHRGVRAATKRKVETFLQ